MIEGCLDCGRQLHELCNECECCQQESGTTPERGTKTRTSNGGGSRGNEEENDTGQLSPRNGVGRPIKEPDDVTDKKSTGRKRAALLYPIFPDKPCEWQGLAKCGGGKFPIIGCREGKQQHRHHGPDKNTMRNEPGNIHRICYSCHNIWHAQNDKDYDPSKNHSPRVATQDEIIERIMKIRYVAD